MFDLRLPSDLLLASELAVFFRAQTVRESVTSV